MHNYKNEKIVLLTHSNIALNDLIEKLSEVGLGDRVVRLGRGGDKNIGDDFSR